MYRDNDPLFFWGEFCDVAKSGDEPEEDLARSGYKLNTNVILWSSFLYFRLYICLNQV